jgi:hypothetical protein
MYLGGSRKIEYSRTSRRLELSQRSSQLYLADFNKLESMSSVIIVILPSLLRPSTFEPNIILMARLLIPHLCSHNSHNQSNYRVHY